MAFPSSARSRQSRTVQNHPELARVMTYGLVDEGFGPASMFDLPVPEAAISHAVMNPLG
jgi:hypothetical protein